MSLIGYAASALFISWVVSRAARWLLFRNETGLRRALAPNGIALVLLTLLEALNATTGPRNVLGALVYYVPAALLLSGMDLLIMRMRSSRKGTGPVPNR